MERPRVVIVGAGFAGLSCARALAGHPVDVTVIDRNNYHLFTPLLYQVASSLLNPSDIVHPVRATVGRSRNVSFRRGEVTGLAPEGQAVLISDGAAIPYDYLVVATGSTTNFFGMTDIETHSYGLKDLAEALELRNHILLCLERAAASPPHQRQPLLTFVVAGGGPTGVEYAGALAELLDLVIPSEYPELAVERPRILLVEGLDRVLPPFAPDLSAKALKELQHKGIEVRTGLRVAKAGQDHVEFADGSTVATRTLVWAAGVRPSGLGEAFQLPQTRSRRVEVDPALRVVGRPNIFAIGDIAAATQGDKEIPMLATPAMQEGKAAAGNIIRAIDGRPVRRFAYRDRGTMATIGKRAAVAQLGKLHLDGTPGWLLWLAVHLYFLIGFRNRVAVLTGWAWNYLRSDRPVRIIARARYRPNEPGEPLVVKTGDL